MAPILEGKSIGSDQNTLLKGELLIWRIKNQHRDQGIVFASNLSKLVPKKLDLGPSSKVDLKFGPVFLF
jgi:hypothetical protein